MQIVLTSVMVDDQQKALAFYTEKLGFFKKQDIPMGEYRWLTVASSEGPQGVELALEPMGIPEARVFQKALHTGNIPLTAFGVSNLDEEYERLRERGVEFRSPPTRGETGPATAMFDDTCGNLILLFEP